jgi:hypothetical protein
LDSDHPTSESRSKCVFVEQWHVYFFSVQRSTEHLQKRGVMVLIGQPKAEDNTGAALLGAAALGALLVAVLAAGKK